MKFLLCHFWIFIITISADVRYKSPAWWHERICLQGIGSEVLGVGPKPSPYATYGDEFDKDNPNFFFQRTGTAKGRRRVHHGVSLPENYYPWTSICNIQQKDDKFHWCTCLIMTARLVLTDRLCFRDRKWDRFPNDSIPDIKITYGSTKKSTHKHTRGVINIFNHPNQDVHVALLQLNDSILFTGHMKPFSPNRWLKTTGWRNLIPKCSTMMCGYGVTEDGATDDLKCIPYAFTSNVETLAVVGKGLWFSDWQRNYTRAWLGSSYKYPPNYKKWVNDEETSDANSPTACTGDSGGALLYWDKHGEGDLYLIGMVTGTRMWKKCGQYGLDLAISMISLVGWLTNFIEGIKNPLIINENRLG